MKWAISYALGRVSRFFLSTTHIRAYTHTMHTFASFIANSVAGHQPPTRSTGTPPIHPADRFVGPIALNKPVSRSPVLSRDEMVMVPTPSQHKRRVVEEDDVTEEVRKEFEAWMKVRIVAVKHSAGANRVWLC